MEKSNRISPLTRDRLFCPGPTPVPQIARVAALNDSVYHRTDAFYKLFLHCRLLLQEVIGAETPPLILTSSGTGAMEACVTNLTEPGDPVVVVEGGKFGQRWRKICEAYQLNVRTMPVEWGTAPSLDALEHELQEIPSCKAVFFQANETSTGVAFPVREMAACIRTLHPEALIVVDGISSLVAHEMQMTNWHIDAVVGGSQKGFGVPPGLAFVALSPRAQSQLSSRPRFYFDLRKEIQGQAEGQTAWTPAVSLIQSLTASLEAIFEAGLSTVTAHHAVMAEAVRAAGLALGLSLFSKSHHSQAVTAFTLPPCPAERDNLVKHMSRRFGMIFAGGQDHLKGKIIRFAHLGFVDAVDILGGIAALEWGLHEVYGRSIDGGGTAAALKILSHEIDS